MTPSGTSEFTRSRHLPLPSSPKPPERGPSPSSSSSDVKVEADAARRTVSVTVPESEPASSMPVIVTDAGPSPLLISRSLLTWFSLLPGLKNTTRWLPSAARGANSCMLVTKPSAVRT